MYVPRIFSVWLASVLGMILVLCAPDVARAQMTEEETKQFTGYISQAKEAFDAQGITIPFPQRTVHMVTEAAAE